MLINNENEGFLVNAGSVMCLKPIILSAAATMTATSVVWYYFKQKQTHTKFLLQSKNNFKSINNFI